MLRSTLAVLIATLALAVGRAAGAETPAHETTPVGEPAAHAAGVHAGAHVEGDERLVPIPPSRDTVVSAVWVIIIFLVMLGILYKTAWQQVLAGLKKREQRIRQDIADAEAARKKAEETLRQYNQQLATAEQQVRDILAKAATDAEKIATSLKMQAQQEAEEIKERANRDIEAARKAAVADVHAQAAELSTLIASKILRRNLKPEDQADLVKSSLDQFEMVGKA